MAKSTIITLPQMVDLALNSPEIGIVNFTVLHSVLHVLVQQLDLVDCNVEFRGSDSERLQNYIANAKPGPIITLTEYTIGPEGEEKPATKKSKGKVEEKGQADETQTEKKGEAPPVAAQKSIVVIEQKTKNKQDHPAGNYMAITQDRYKDLMGDIKDLQEKVKELAELPANLGLVTSIRSDKPSPVLDMFHILTLTKRIDGIETGMKKLATIIEDLALENKGEGPLVEEKAQPIKNKEFVDLEKRVTVLEKKRGGSGKQTRVDAVQSQDGTAKDEAVIIDGEVPKKIESVESVYKDGEDATGDQQTDASSFVQPAVDYTNVNLSEMPTTEAVVLIQQDLESIHEQLSDIFNKFTKDIVGLKKMLKKADGSSEVGTGQVDVDLKDINGRIITLEERLKTFQIAGGTMNQAGDESLYKKVGILEEELTGVQHISRTLWDERKSKQYLFELLQTNVDGLKNMKADKDDIEEALAEKADLCLLDTKVSSSRFDEMSEQLNQAIAENHSSMRQQLGAWILQLNDISEEVHQKLDAQELEELKEYTNNKLKMLNDKIRVLANLKENTEAAGSKSKFLRNITCISCDKEVTMRKELDSTAFPKAPVLPAGKSMGAYLAYELDHLRRQQKCTNKNKNLNMLEQALLSGKQDKVETDHICNRYCGGSHTTTTPEQRVTRVGHFLNQWDPDNFSVVDEGVRGTDGKIYKGHDKKTEKIKEASIEGTEKIQFSQILADFSESNVRKERLSTVSDDHHDTLGKLQSIKDFKRSTPGSIDRKNVSNTDALTNMAKQEAAKQ